MGIDVNEYIRRDMERTLGIFSDTQEKFLYRPLPMDFYTLQMQSDSAALRRSHNEMYISHTIEPEKINQNIKDNFRRFVEKVNKNEGAPWIDVPLSLWDHATGRTIKVVRGSHWQKGEDLYIGNDPSQSMPVWVPGFLSAVQFHIGLGGDQQIKDWIMDIAAKLMAKVMLPLRRHYLAQDIAQGLEINTIAFNTQTNLIAARYPGLEGGEPEWKDMSGVVVEIDIASEDVTVIHT